MYNLEKAAQKPTGEQNKLCFKKRDNSQKKLWNGSDTVINKALDACRIFFSLKFVVCICIKSKGLNY